MDEELVTALRRDYTEANISEQDRTMLDYVVKLTKDATKCSREDHARLRSVGFDDRGILQITLIASWFNYINRVADSLGVGRDWSSEDLIRQSGQPATAGSSTR
ncbi:MAG: carboxymuconolactone decarboxylase family protein [Acidobacteriota bacterium]